MTMENVKMGQVFESRKVTGQQGTVTAINEKIELTLNNGEVKKVSQSTLGRWWKLVEDAKETTQESEAANTSKEEEKMEVLTQEQQQEQPTDGEIVDTNKVEDAPVDTNKDEKPADDTNKAEQPKPTHRGRGKQPTDPVMQEMFNNMIAHMVEKGCTKRVTSGYVGLFIDKRNIAEITLQKKGIRLNLNSQSLSSKNFDLCKVVPDTYGWTLDSVYKVTNDEEYTIAVEMLEQGFAFRNKPVEVKKEDNKVENAQ